MYRRLVISLFLVFTGCAGQGGQQMPAAGPLHEAVCEGDLDEINRLLDKGFDIHYQDINRYDATPLHQAVLCGQVSSAELLITRGAKVDARGGRIVGTPLYVASYSGNIKIAKLLIKKGADVNAISEDGNTPLHAAAREGEVVVAKLLIAKGADIEVKTRNGKTPLDIAILSGHEEVAELFQKLGSKSDEKPPSPDDDSASQFVVVDQMEPAFIVFTGIPKTIDREQFEKIKLQVSERETLRMLSWEQFLESVNDYARSVMLRNNYPDINIVDGLVCLVASKQGSGAPWGLTWNGGIALTRNDYQHARRTYESYKADPDSYKPIRNPRKDPIHPGGHLPFGGCN